MKTVSRFNRIIPAFAIIAIALPIIVSAAGAGTAVDIVTPIADNVLKLVRVLVLIVFVLAIVAFGWGIVKFIFAGGDPTKIGEAKSFLLWGVIGMAVMASLFGLITFLQQYFGVNSGGLNILPPIVANQV